MAIVAILAGGVGSRMGSEKPKQFLELNKKPVIIRAVENYLSAESVEKVYLVVNEKWMDYTKNLLHKYKLNDNRIKLYDGGGSSRFITMFNVTKQALLDGYGDKDIILADCARPFVPKDVINNLASAKKDYNLVTCCIQSANGIFLLKDFKDIIMAPSRSISFINQGPQIVNIKEFYEIANTLPDKTDQLLNTENLYLDLGKSVGVVEGSPYSFKLTTQLDLKVGEVVAKELDILHETLRKQKEEKQNEEENERKRKRKEKDFEM